MWWCRDAVRSGPRPATACTAPPARRPVRRGCRPRRARRCEATGPAYRSSPARAGGRRSRGRARWVGRRRRGLHRGAMRARRTRGPGWQVETGANGSNASWDRKDRRPVLARLVARGQAFPLPHRVSSANLPDAKGAKSGVCLRGRGRQEGLAKLSLWAPNEIWKKTLPSPNSTRPRRAWGANKIGYRGKTRFRLTYNYPMQLKIQSS